MAEENSDILLGSVQFVLSNWSVLQLAVENSFGGADTTEKAKWMVDVVNQVLRDNSMYRSLSFLERWIQTCSIKFLCVVIIACLMLLNVITG